MKKGNDKIRRWEKVKECWVFLDLRVVGGSILLFVKKYLVGFVIWLCYVFFKDLK